MRLQKTRLFIYSFSHFAVDMCCFFAIYSSVVNSPDAAVLILLYNALAFGLQAPLGAFGDRLDDVRPLAVLGCGLVALGVMAKSLVLVCTVLIGLGNALFHVGGALASLRHRPGDALYAGIYVAPGALGTAAGLLSASSSTLGAGSCLLLMLICVLLMLAAGPGPARGCETVSSPADLPSLPAFAVLLCILSIGIRSFAGFSADTTGLVMLGGVCAFGGKLLGGVFARKRRVDVLALAGVGVGGLMMAFFGGTGAVYAGILLFNLAMPLTLSAVMKSLPGHEGLGFGLTTLALLLGWLPLICFDPSWTAPSWLMTALTLAAAFMLFFALKPRSSDAGPVFADTETQQNNNTEVKHDETDA